MQVGDAKKTYIKDGAASQQHQPQVAPPTGSTKKPPQAPKKSDPKAGKGDSSETAGSEASAPGGVKKTTAAQPKPPPTKPKTDNPSNEKPKNSNTKSDDAKVNNRGTVKPYASFNADEDSEKLNSAMSEDNGEKTIISIVPKRSNKQRQQLKATYEQKFKKV